MESADYKQEWVKIGNLEVPVIIEDGIKYYPISYITEKILLRQKNGLIGKNNVGDYKEHIKTFKVKFSESNTQTCNCITEEKLKDRLIDTQQSRLSLEKRRSQNMLHDYLNIEPLHDQELVINKISKEELLKHDAYTISEIRYYIDDDNVKYLLCSKCSKYYPLNNVFYYQDERNTYGYSKICNVCSGRRKEFDNPIVKKEKETETFKINMDQLYPDNMLYEFYELFLENRIKALPDCYHSKEFYSDIIKWLGKNNKINSSQVNYRFLKHRFGLEKIEEYHSLEDIHILIYGEDYKLTPWRYTNYKLKSNYHNLEEARTIFDIFTKEEHIETCDLLNIDYRNIILRSEIKLRSTIDFILYYTEYKYGGYKFNLFASKKYYESDDNILFDLKKLIEEMNIKTYQIPLYLTKKYIMNHAPALYRGIYSYRKNHIYDWINKIYPDYFIPTDFDTNYHRSEFDSDEESKIHDILTSTLKNVIYNTRNQDTTITIKNMQPDWIIIGETKCWLIEYFGLYQEIPNSKITNQYSKRVVKKIKTYESELTEYGKVYLYPDDLKMNFKGVRDKIKDIR